MNRSIASLGKNIQHFNISLQAGTDNHDKIIGVLLDEDNAVEACSGHTGFSVGIQDDQRSPDAIIASLNTRLESFNREHAQADRAQAIETLRELLPPRTVVQCMLRQVARSGMSRNIDFYVIVDGDLRCLTSYFSRIYPGVLTDNGLRVSGCGMDMGFAVVYHVARVLYPEGFTCCGRGQYPDTCPSNDHFNGDRNYEPHTHSDGGYALRSNWI